MYGLIRGEFVFYINVFKTIPEIGNDTYIICGEFNLIVHPNVDCSDYKHINNQSLLLLEAQSLLLLESDCLNYRQWTSQ